MTRLDLAAARVYRLALRAFPARHRAVYATEMVDAFGGALAEVRRGHGRWRAFRFVVAACLDAVRAGLGERRRHSRRVPNPWHVLDSVGRDLTHAVRSLAKARAFSLVSVISLGIGIGTVIAILVVVRGLTGRPPGVTQEGLVELLIIPQGSLRAQVDDWAIDTWSYPDFADVRDADTGMTIAGWTPGERVLRAGTGGGGVRVDAMFVSANYFTTVGVALARGPGFNQAKSVGQPEVIVGHRVWQNRLGAAPEIIGSTIVVNGISHVVVGVTPNGFRGHFAQHRPGFELWLPLRQHPRLAGQDSLRFNRDVDWVHVLGRLSSGTSRVEANGVVSSIMAGLAERHPASNGLKSASVEPYFGMGARRRGDIMAEGGTLLVASGMVLLVVCLNMSGMVLVRSATRERELAVRLAIGASRGRLIQYLLSEAVVLAMLGGALGAAVIFGIPAALTWWAGTPLEISFTPNAPIVAACIGLCLATSLVFGLLPAVRFSRPTVMAALKDEGGGGGRRVGRIHRWTAAVQAGIAVPFLVVGGVRLDQVRTTATADLGFEPAGLFAASLDLAAAGRADRDATFVLRTVQSHLERAGGVVSVSVANGLPLDFQSRHTRVVRDGASAPVRAHTTRVSPGYLETMGVPLLRGRGITADDQTGSDPVVLISEALAARLFPKGEPLGERLTFALEGTHAPVDFRWPHLSVPSPAQTFTVVGVTADLVDAYMGPPEPQLFVPLAQHPASRVFVIARSSATTEAMASAFENAVSGLYPDPDVIRSSVMTGERLVRKSMSDLAFGSTLAGVAGGIALLLAALGVFGVVGFMVATRSREIGIRIALGASRSRVLRAVLVDAVKLVVWGVAGGLALAFVFVREVAWSSLGGVEPLLYTAAAAITLGVALVAALPAARRAAAVEPIVAMRAE